MAKPEATQNPAPTNAMRKKLFGGIFVLLLAMTGLICYNLVGTAIIKAEYYRAKANDQQLRPFTIPANRGTIYDRNGKILAQSKTVWDIIISPSTIKSNAETFQQQRERAAMREYHKNIEDGLPAIMPAAGTKYDEAEEICCALADILEFDDEEYEKLLKRIRESDLGYEVVKRQVEKPEVDKLNEFKKERGIGRHSVEAMESTKRLYPNGSLAAAVIGFTNFDNDGVYGIEARYDEYLQGVDGLFVMARDANNQPMPYDYEMRYDAQNGNSLYLTLDEVLQHYLEKNLELAVSEHKPENRATGIIMDANTGAILAMATYPSFNLNEPDVLSEYDLERLAKIREEKVNDTLILSGFDVGTEADLSPEQIEKIDKDIADLRLVMRETQWKNKAISELYFPGSVFKVITLASALEEHVVDLDTTFSCSGVHVIGETKIGCWSSAGHGTLNGVTEAITGSCNPAFIEISRRLGPAKFSDYFDAFGFTKKTGIDLPGEASSLFIKRDNMGVIDLAVSSFGQANKITPIQMITAYAASVNGGYLVTPYVVDKIVDNDGNIIHSTEPNIKRQVISEETSSLMKQILEDVVKENGGHNAYIAGYRIGGKSGTSEKLDEFPDPDEKHYVASFAAFTPANNPDIIMLVMVDDPQGGQIYGSRVAAPVVSAVFQETLPYLEIYPAQLSDEELELQNVMVPYLVGLPRAKAAADLDVIGLNYEFIGDGGSVLYTIPDSNETIAKNGVVRVFMEEQDYNTAYVPNVIGLTLEQANEVIADAGLNIKLVGAVYNEQSKASWQSIEPGEEVPAGTVIEVEFLFVDGHAG